MKFDPADDPTKHKILMVLEYVEGGSLFAGTQISPKKRLSELQARKYFRDVLQVTGCFREIFEGNLYSIDL